MAGFQFFGKEPALIVGFVQSLLTALVVFVPDFLTNTQVVLIVAAINALGALFIAWRTRHTTLAVVLGGLNALAALVAGFGYSLSPEQVGGIALVLTAIFSFFNRTQTSPVAARAGDATVEPKPV